MSTSNKKYWIKSGMYSFFEKGSGFVFNFGSFYMLVRSLSQEDMGIWVLFIAVCSFLEVSRIGLIQNGLVKYISSDGETSYREILTASIILNIALTIAYIFFLFIGGQFLSNLWNSEVLTTLFLIYAATTVVLMPLNQFNYIQQANMDFQGIFWAGFVKQAFFFFYVLYLYLFDVTFGLTDLAIFQIIAFGAGLIVAFFFAKPYLRLSKNIDWAWVKKLLDFGKYSVGTNLSSMLYKSMDKMMLGSMVSGAAVAVYEIAIKVTNLLEIPTLAAAPVIFPKSAQNAAKDGLLAAASLYEKSVGLILALILPGVLVVQLIPELIITLIAGDQYLDTIPLLRFVVLFSLFTPFLYQTGITLESVGKPKINFYFTVVSFFLNFLLNAIFITQFGIVGAAYGTLVTYFIVFCAGQFMLKKLVGVETENIFKNIINFYKQGFSFVKNRMPKAQTL